MHQPNLPILSPIGRVHLPNTNKAFIAMIAPACKPLQHGLLLNTKRLSVTDEASHNPRASRAANPLPSLPYRAAAIIGRKPLHFTFSPDAAARAAIAAHLGVISVDHLVFKGVFSPKGRSDVQLRADLTAQITQACIITFAPVAAQITSPVARDYLRDYIEPSATEAELGPEDHEPIPEEFDVAAIAIEELLLSLPLYPRAAGAELGAVVAAPKGAQPLTDDALRPFAGLATLAQAMALGPDAAPDTAPLAQANSNDAENKGKTPK